MQINKNSTIADVPANTVRKILRKTGLTIDAAEAAKAIQWNVDRARTLMGELTKLGYFTEAAGSYTISEQGRAVRDAKWVNDPTRATAENLLQRVIETSETVNRLPYISHYVSDIHVVGSFLDDGDYVTKLELVVRLGAYTDEDIASRRVGEREVMGTEDIMRVLRRHGEHVVVHLEEDAKKSLGGRLVFKSMPGV